MQYKTDLQQLLAQRSPTSLLCLGPPCPEAIADYLQAAPGRWALQLDSRHVAERLHTVGRFDYTVITGALEHMTKQEALHLLAQVRDLHGGRFALRLPIGEQPRQTSQWDGNELLALGMIQVGAYQGDSGIYHLYRYDVEDYKVVPDWLNARYWAHPERWDKEYW